MQDAPCDGQNGAEVWMAASAMPNLFTRDSVFLSGEGQKGVGCGLDVGVRGCGKVEESVANIQFYIQEAKRGREGRC